jgi:ribokinase
MVPAGGLDASELTFVDILTPNRGELSVVAGGADEPVEALAGRLLGPGLVREAVVVTLGAEGALLVDAAGTRRFRAPAVAAVDATGAGDAFNGVLAAMLAAGSSLDDAVDRAVAAATRSDGRRCPRGCRRGRAGHRPG